MGRDRDNERREHFAKLTRQLLSTPAWRALSPAAQALYPWLKLEWRGPSANNNGQICLSVRQAAEAMGVNAKTAARAFHDLQRKGFIAVSRLARLGVKGEARGNEYELTEIPMPHSGHQTGRRLYLDWEEGADCPVHKAAIHNPRGTNGKTKTLSPNSERVVPIFGTKP